VSAVRRDQAQGSGAIPTSWSGKLIFGAGVIVAVGLLGVLSHLIVYLTSQKLQDRLFAIAVIAQVTFAMYRVSHRFNLKLIIIGLNEVALWGDDLGQFAQICRSQHQSEITLITKVGFGSGIQASGRNSTACFRGFSSPCVVRIQWSSMDPGCTGGSHCILRGARPL